MVEPEQFVPNTDDLVNNNRLFAKSFPDSGLPLAPKRHLAIVACMDSRMDIFQMLGLSHGDAHIIRNAGGVVTDDVIRSLVLSQRRLGTQEVILIHHEIEDECGIRPWWALESFRDPYKSVTQNMKRLSMSPFIKHKMHIRGFVYDVTDGLLHEAQ